jgi:pimeloyl-ACP methyl ester carboxylesterase
VLVHGMGDLRAGYRFLAPGLRAAGYRMACTDLRGYGDSDATFTSYGGKETAGDVIALIEVPGGPAVVVGEQDPDFSDPRAEADWIARALRAQMVMVPEAGHYPQSQQPDITVGAVLHFLESVGGRA